jgi:hypothetical protein
VVGVFFVGMFMAVVLAYACTEYLFVLVDARRRVLVGHGHALLLVLGVNLASFVLVVLCAFIFVLASGTPVYGSAALVCLCAQAVWLAQHLWFYYRDHLRLRYEPTAD